MITEAGLTSQTAASLPRTFSRRELGIGVRDLALRCYALMAAEGLVTSLLLPPSRPALPPSSSLYSPGWELRHVPANIPFVGLQGYTHMLEAIATSQPVIAQTTKALNHQLGEYRRHLRHLDYGSAMQLGFEIAKEQLVETNAPGDQLVDLSNQVGTTAWATLLNPWLSPKTRIQIGLDTETPIQGLSGVEMTVFNGLFGRQTATARIADLNKVSQGQEPSLEGTDRWRHAVTAQYLASSRMRLERLGLGVQFNTPRILDGLISLLAGSSYYNRGRATAGILGQLYEWVSAFNPTNLPDLSAHALEGGRFESDGGAVKDFKGNGFGANAAAAFEYALRHGKSFAPIIDELNNPAYRDERADPALNYLRQAGIIGSPLKERAIFGY